MGRRVVTFVEPLHHTCLMYGLKATFERIPSLNRRVLEVRGEVVMMENFVAPPPMMSNPKYVRSNRRMRNLLEVTYWRESLVVEYNDVLCRLEDVNRFMEHLIRDYLHYRHPFMKIEIKSDRVLETTSGSLVAEIL